MTEEEKFKIYKECEKIKQDASKCKREWDDIDRWATNGSELNDEDDEFDAYYRDHWQPYETCVEPFLRSKYLKYGKPIY